MRFLVDMPLSPDLAEWLRNHGHDAVHAGDRSLSKAPDTEVLGTAIAEERTIITADLDFPRLLAMLGTKGPGLILLRGANYSDVEVSTVSAGYLRQYLLPSYLDQSWLSTAKKYVDAGCLYRSATCPAIPISLFATARPTR